MLPAHAPRTPLRPIRSADIADARKDARVAADTRKFVCPFINLGTPIHEQRKIRTLALVKD